MQLSARLLGREYGLTSEEMNRVLKKLNFLKGIPGSYEPTEKALPYVHIKNFHRGKGGYAHYNRYWSTRTYDESIKDVLEITNELISEVKAETAASRAARYVTQIADKGAGNFIKETTTNMPKLFGTPKLKVTSRLKKAGKVGLIISGIVAAGYGIYKVVPHIKQWGINHKDSRGEKLDNMGY